MSGSPKNTFQEIDLSFGVENLSSENVGAVLAAEWGPANFPLAVTSKKNLYDTIGGPIIGTNEKTWMACREFLNNYSKSLYVLRSVKDDNTTRNAFLGVCQDTTYFDWDTRHKTADYPRKLNEDDADPTINAVVLKMILSSFAGATPSVGQVVTQLNTAASGTIIGVDDGATKILWVGVLTTTNQFSVKGADTLSTATMTASVVTTILGRDSVYQLEVGTVANLRVGDTITQDTTAATGVIVGLTEGGGTDYAYVHPTNYIPFGFDGTGATKFITTGRSTTSTVVARSYAGFGGMSDAFSFYAIYPGTKGNTIKVAVCDPENYYKSGSTVVVAGTTDTFKSLFEDGPNSDYVYAPLLDSKLTSSIMGFYTAAQIAALTTKPTGAALAAGDRVIATTTDATYTANQIYQYNGANWTTFTTPVYAVTSNSYRAYMVYDSYLKKYWTWNGTTWTAFLPQVAVVVLVDDEVVEKWIVSTDPNDVDDQSTPLFIDEYLEQNSNWIRSVSKTSQTTGQETIDAVAGWFHGYIQATALTGGASAAVTLATLEATVDEIFKNDQFTIDFIMDNHDVNGSFLAADVKTFQNYIIGKVAVDKMRFGVFTLPSSVIDTTLSSDSAAVASAITYMEGVTVESRCFTQDNWKKIYDEYNCKRYYIPCTGDFAGAIVRSGTDSGIEKAPYGTSRGIIQNADQLMHKTTSGMRDLLYDNRVNSIFYMRNRGVMLWGQKTLYNKATSAISRINARRVLTQIEKDIMTALIDFNGENSNAELWSRITNVCDNSYLAVKKTIGWLNDYKFVCDASNNPPEVQDLFELYIDVAVKLPRTAEYIKVRFLVVKNSMSFDEVL